MALKNYIGFLFLLMVYTGFSQVNSRSALIDIKGSVKGKAYVLNREFKKAISTLDSLLEVKNMVPYQRIELFEALGDAKRGMSNPDEVMDFYKEGLEIAQKNQVSPKIIDLNSKIADAYASGDRLIEAEGFLQQLPEFVRGSSPGTID